MNENLAPQEPSSVVSEVLEHLNLPQIIAGQAGKAISRLVAGALDVPKACLESFAQEIRNKTKAKQVVSDEIAAAAAKLATADPNIMARACYNLVAREYRHQQNKEDIARKAIDELVDAKPTEAGEEGRSQPLPAVDEDWLDVFARHAQEASSERLRLLWARILAGEIRRPKTFSLKTLRFVAELDQTTAQLFEKYVPRIYSVAISVKSPLSGTELQEVMHLQDAGLITGVGGYLTETITLDEHGKAAVPHQGKWLLLFGTPKAQVRNSIVMLTTTGKEIARLVQRSFNVEAAKVVVELMPKQNLNSVAVGTLISIEQGFAVMSQEVIWQKETPPSHSTPPSGQ